MTKIKRKRKERCSFCNKKAEEVKTLLASLKAFICNECIILCYSQLDSLSKVKLGFKDEK